MKNHPCDIYKIARQCGVKLFDGIKHSPSSRKPFECYCKDTLRAIGQEHGEQHLKLVLMLMTGTRENADCLYSDTMKAVSQLILSQPALGKSPTLIEDMNRVSLPALRERIRLKSLPVRSWQALLVVLSEIFTPNADDYGMAA